HTQGHQYGDPLAAATDAHLRIPAVHEHVADILVDEITGAPRLEVLAQAADQPRHRILRQRTAAQQRRQGALDAPRVAARQVHAQNRFVDARGPALISAHRLAPPLGARPLAVTHPRPRHRDRRRPQARRQRPLPRPMPIALARLANACRFDGAQRRLELLLHQLFDRVSDSQPHRQLDAVRAERRNLFLLAWLLGTVLHRVILPAPAAKRARSSWLELRRMMTRFLLFHQTQDTTAPRRAIWRCGVDVIHQRCAGLDVHKDEVVACARTMSGRKVVRTSARFATTTRGLLALSEWLSTHQCQTVALEAT